MIVTESSLKSPSQCAATAKKPQIAGIIRNGTENRTEPKCKNPDVLTC